MSSRLDFETVCADGHTVTVSFSHEEFEAELKSDALVFHCNTGDTSWTPTREDVAKLHRLFPGV